MPSMASLTQRGDLGLRAAERYFIPFFLSDERVRFQTIPAAFKAAVSVAICTGWPPASTCRASSPLAVNGVAPASATILCNSCSLSLCGAPQRGES